MNEYFQNIAQTNESVAKLSTFWRMAEEYTGILPVMEFYLRFYVLTQISSQLTRRPRAQQQRDDPGLPDRAGRLPAPPQTEHQEVRRRQGRRQPLLRGQN